MKQNNIWKGFLLPLIVSMIIILGIVYGMVEWVRHDRKMDNTEKVESIPSSKIERKLSFKLTSTNRIYPMTVNELDTNLLKTLNFGTWILDYPKIVRLHPGTMMNTVQVLTTVRDSTIVVYGLIAVVEPEDPYVRNFEERMLFKFPILVFFACSTALSA